MDLSHWYTRDTVHLLNSTLKVKENTFAQPRHKMRARLCNVLFCFLSVKCKGSCLNHRLADWLIASHFIVFKVFNSVFSLDIQFAVSPVPCLFAGRESALLISMYCAIHVPWALGRAVFLDVTKDLCASLDVPVSAGMELQSSGKCVQVKATVHAGEKTQTQAILSLPKTKRHYWI